MEKVIVVGGTRLLALHQDCCEHLVDVGMEATHTAFLEEIKAREGGDEVPDGRKHLLLYSANKILQILTHCCLRVQQAHDKARGHLAHTSANIDGCDAGTGGFMDGEQEGAHLLLAQVLQLVQALGCEELQSANFAMLSPLRPISAKDNGILRAKEHERNELVRWAIGKHLVMGEQHLLCQLWP